MALIHPVFKKILLLFLMLRNIKCEDAAHVVLEDVIIDYVNSEYLDEETFNMEIIYHTDSPNGITVHCDIIKELPQSLNVKLSVWSRAFGQYNVPTGIYWCFNICSNFTRKLYIDSAWETFLGSTKSCPPNPGSYEINDFPVDSGAVSLNILSGMHIQINIEVFGEPNITILKFRHFYQIK